jgi:hypothetical protein
MTANTWGKYFHLGSDWIIVMPRLHETAKIGPIAQNRMER